MSGVYSFMDVSATIAGVGGVVDLGYGATVAEEGIDRYVDFLRRVGAPLILSEAGVPDDPAYLDKYADHAGEAGGSFVQIHRDDARAILEACKEPVSF